MLTVLAYLVQEEDVKEDDYAVAISLALEKNQTTRAYSWAHQAMRTFPQSKILAPLYVQSLRRSDHHSEAEQYLYSLSPEWQNLPIMQLERGILYYNSGQLADARALFQVLIDIDSEADFGKEAQEYLQKIEEKEREERQKEQEQASFSG